MTDGLLNAREAADRLGISYRTFMRYRRRRFFDRCLARTPIGTRKYVAAQIDAIKDGESVTVFRRTG